MHMCVYAYVCVRVCIIENIMSFGKFVRARTAFYSLHPRGTNTDTTHGIGFLPWVIQPHLQMKKLTPREGSVLFARSHTHSD